MEIRYPLSKRLIAVMWERTYAESELPEVVASDGRCVAFDTENVRYCNAQQVAQCARQVYSPSGDFSLVCEVEAKNPGATDRPGLTADAMLTE
jgi:hypothetical protein